MVPGSVVAHTVTTLPSAALAMRLSDQLSCCVGTRLAAQVSFAEAVGGVTLQQLEMLAPGDVPFAERPPPPSPPPARERTSAVWIVVIVAAAAVLALVSTVAYMYAVQRPATFQATVHSPKARPEQVSPLPQLSSEAFAAPEEDKEEAAWKPPVLFLEAPESPAQADGEEDVERLAPDRSNSRLPSSPAAEAEASSPASAETAKRRQQTTAELAREYRERLEAEVRAGQEYRAALAAQRSHWAQDQV